MAATWRANTFLLVSFPVGIATFAFLVTAITLGVSLAIVWVGVPILAATLVASRWLARFERRRVGFALAQPVQSSYRAPHRRGMLGWLHTAIGDAATWKDLLWLLILLPALGLAGFTIAICAWGTGLGLLTLPAWYSAVGDPGVDLGALDVDTIDEAWIGIPVGLVVLTLAVPLTRGAAVLALVIAALLALLRLLALQLGAEDELVGLAGRREGVDGDEVLHATFGGEAPRAGLRVRVALAVGREDTGAAVGPAGDVGAARGVLLAGVRCLLQAERVLRPRRKAPHVDAQLVVAPAVDEVRPAELVVGVGAIGADRLERPLVHLRALCGTRLGSVGYEGQRDQREHCDQLLQLVPPRWVLALQNARRRWKLDGRGPKQHRDPDPRVRSSGPLLRHP
jgi:hypothetical protein